MTREKFHKLFIGFLLVFIDINLIIVDVLPDPLGYFFIYRGLQAFIEDSLVRKAKAFALNLIFLSIPTMFVLQKPHGNSFEFFSYVNGWTIYENTVALFKLVLVYYLFKIMIEIAQSHKDLLLTNRTNKTFKLYTRVMLIIFFLQPFYMNFRSNIWMIVSFFLIVGFLMMEIAFLILLTKFKKIKDRPFITQSSDMIRD